ncbi:MAG: hypothetical protein QCI00_08550 [Candidatus Thermoplasmatota archaeon]|nr:hypothetical protein [Candidatus Thermoplasmatota archaeon]
MNNRYKIDSYKNSNENSSRRSSKTGIRSKDEMKKAIKDEKELKRKQKRLTIDWFFRPSGD